jgi:thioredoxin 1
MLADWRRVDYTDARSTRSKGFFMAVQTTTDANFATDVLQSDKLVLVDFWAEWCGPCRAIAPILDDLATEMSQDVKIVKVNIDENPDLPVKYGVRSIPTLMLFKNGEVLETQVGGGSKQTLQEWIQQAI